MTPLGFSEQQFIDWVTAARGPARELPLGPGDDAAVLHDGTVITVDTIVEGVHFAPGTELELVARKALGACLSDLCAMGAIAEAVLVSAQLPPGCDGQRLAQGLAAWAQRFAVAIAGGDTVATAPGALALAVTGCGRCPAGRRPWLRSGARPGDTLLVTGPLGGSLAGRHLRVRPRSDVVAWLHRQAVEVHAAMDLSDGLLADLPRLCAASGVGADLRALDLPIHADARQAADPLMAALGDGEDFELLLALPPAAPAPPGAVAVGFVTANGLRLMGPDGVGRPWPRGGYAHAF